MKSKKALLGWIALITTGVGVIFQLLDAVNENYHGDPQKAIFDLLFILVILKIFEFDF